jgi:hypothetical protein
LMKSSIYLVGIFVNDVITRNYVYVSKWRSSM